MPSHIEIAQLWVAHNEGDYRRFERSGFNMYYRDSTIYSYGPHFPIARFATGPNGERAVLFTDHGYSISTSKHIGYVRRALGYSRTVHYVRDPSSRDWRALAEECRERAKALRASAKRRRIEWRREDDLKQAEAAAKSAAMFTRWNKVQQRLAIAANQ
jgi:hypothetical protein